MVQNLVLFGASNLGRIAYYSLKEKYNIKYFCDNDKKKWGKEFYGIKIVSPEKLKDLSDIKVIITNGYYNEISEQLLSMGIKNIDEFKADDVSKYELEAEEYFLNLKEINVNMNIFKDYYLHIMLDNMYTKRFIKFINKYFDSNKHLFIIISQSNTLQHLNKDDFNNVEIIPLQANRSQLYYYVKYCKKLFIHFLSDYICQFLYEYNIEKDKMVWKLWGADLYNYIDINLYDKLTENLLIKNNIVIKKFEEYKESVQYIYRKESIKKFSYILSGFKEDYNLIKNNFEVTGEYKPFFYPNPIDFSLLENQDQSVDSEYDLKSKFSYLVQVGNSGYPSNNHLEIFKELQKKKGEDFAVVVPLSYGSKKYIKEIIGKGSEILGEKFIPLLSFIEPKNYFSILSQVDIAIMNQNRSQGAGNIFALLYLGKKVYLKNFTSIYIALKKLGIKVFDVQKTQDINFDELSQEDKLRNKEIVLNYFSEERSLNNMKKIFDI